MICIQYNARHSTGTVYVSNSAIFVQSCVARMPHSWKTNIFLFQYQPIMLAYLLSKSYHKTHVSKLYPRHSHTECTSYFIYLSGCAIELQVHTIKNSFTVGKINNGCLWYRNPICSTFVYWSVVHDINWHTHTHIHTLKQRTVKLPGIKTN